MTIFNFCAVCDEVRVELGTNKPIIIGFFGMLPYVDMAVPFPSQPVSRLTFFFMSGAPVKAGKYRFAVRIKGPNGQELPLQQEPLEREAFAGGLNVMLLIQPMPLDGLGRYEVTAIVNDQDDFSSYFFVSELPQQ
jgi:hypothetical protein